MELTSIVESKNCWKIEYKDRAKDGESVAIRYPADVKELDKTALPSKDFLESVAKFVSIAIAISHLDRTWWLQNGANITAVKLKDGKEDRSIQMTIEATEEKENFKPLKITTHWAELMQTSSVLQTTDPSCCNLFEAIDNLEAEAERYVSGDRFAEQTVINFEQELNK